MTRGLLRLLGGGLILYGLAGVLLLAVVATTLAQPLDDITRLGTALQDQQAAALDALEDAGATISQTAGAVRNLETSLVEARQATDRAAQLTAGMALTMSGLAQQMQLTVLGIQPLIGLAPGFEQSALQLELLSGDVEAIGAALEANREDAVAVADGLDELGRSLSAMRVAVASTPEVSLDATSLRPIQMGVLAVLVWLLVAALFSVLAGVGCLWASRSARRGSIEPTA